MNKLSAKVETERLQDLFCRNVFLFLQNADIILADPQMAYCAVPFKCGTAQSGSFLVSHWEFIWNGGKPAKMRHMSQMMVGKR